MRQASAAVPGHRAGTEEPAASPPVPLSPVPEPVRPEDFGRDGRFEKFILALQSLRLDLGGVASRTDRVERMRAAAEELFSIDGLPQPVPPMTGPAVASMAAADGAARESVAPEATATVEPTDAADAEPRIASAETPAATARPAPPAKFTGVPAPSTADPMPGEGAPEA